MSSSFTRQGRNHHTKSSRETYESLPDSEEPTSSPVRLPQSLFTPSGTPKQTPPPLPPKPNFSELPSTATATLWGTTTAPPPLPPKPPFARGTVVLHSAPPPLPPKPENARGEKLLDPSGKARGTIPSPFAVFPDPISREEGVQPSNPLPPPSRPVPPVPLPERKPSYGEDGSWVPSFPDERSQAGAPFPPEPTIISDGDPMRSSLGKDGQDTSTLSLSDRVANVALPLPPPPFAAHQHCIASAFQRYTVSNHTSSHPRQRNLTLSSEGAEDSYIGALVISRDRVKASLSAPRYHSSPIPWRLYKSQEPGGEAWSVLQEYLTNVSLKSHGRNRALQLLTGYVVGACLESADAGANLLTEIVRRMRGAERSERDGSIFTLLINIGAHVSFVQRVSWSSVEEVTTRVFSEVVEEMHGRQDDDVMWERALRCFLVLCKSSDRHPSDDTSSNCLAALALHLGDMTHTDVDHILITEGLCPRLQTSRDDHLNYAGVDVKCLEDIGGIDTILTLYARTASPSARHRLFGVIYDITVLQCLEDFNQDEIIGLRDHIATFRALFEAHEISDLFVHTFRVGPGPEFVIDTIRMLLFYPLSSNAIDVMHGRGPLDRIGRDQTVFQENSENQSACEVELHGEGDSLIRTAVSRYVKSTRTLLKMLDRKLCLKILRQMERMATQHSGILAQRETVHFAREWKILSEIEEHVQHFLFLRDSKLSTSIGEVLTKLYIAVVDITSGRSNMKSVLHMAEMIIELFTMRTPYATSHGRRVTAVESLPQMFLRGKLSVSRELLEQANPSIFTLLLLASQRKVPPRRLSESRQCLVEFLGSRKDRMTLLKTFVNDDDPAVAYRASEVVSKFADVSLQPRTPLGTNGDAT